MEFRRAFRPVPPTGRISNAIGPCRTNERFGTLTWKPIVFLDRRHSHEEIRELYRMAGVCIVTSLRKGMNRAAKEFVAARDDSGVLIIPGG